MAHTGFFQQGQGGGTGTQVPFFGSPSFEAIPNPLTEFRKGAGGPIIGFGQGGLAPGGEFGGGIDPLSSPDFATPVFGGGGASIFGDDSEFENTILEGLILTGASLLGGGGGGGGGNVSPITSSNQFLRQLFQDPAVASMFQQGILDFAFGAPGLSPLESLLAENLLGPESFFPGLLEESTDFLTELLEGPVGELVETGFRTDAGPIFEEAFRQFETRALPEAAERAGALFGVSSSPFIAAGTRAGQELFGQASAAQVALDEAAAARRLSGLPFAANLAGARLALPLGATQDVLSIGNLLRGIQSQQQGRPLDVFAQLAGLESRGPFVQQGFPTTSSTVQILQALANTLPATTGGGGGIGEILGEIFGGGDEDVTNIQFLPG